MMTITAEEDNVIMGMFCNSCAEDNKPCGTDYYFGIVGVYITLPIHITTHATPGSRSAIPPLSATVNPRIFLFGRMFRACHPKSVSILAKPNLYPPRVVGAARSRMMRESRHKFIGQNILIWGRITDRMVYVLLGLQLGKYPPPEISEPAGSKFWFVKHSFFFYAIVLIHL